MATKLVRLFYAAIAGIPLLLQAAPAAAELKKRDQYVQLDPSIKEWIEGLTNGEGGSCCATADGTRVEDADWQRVGTQYQVRIQGSWYPITKVQLITKANRVGYAIVWYYLDEQGKLKIRCFLPGSES